MLGVLVNTACVIVGSAIGLIAKKVIPEKCASFVMSALALCVLYIGISGTLECDNVIIVIVSMVVGSIIGYALKLDNRLNRLGESIQSRFKNEDGRTNIAEGFVTASLLFCVGAMTIVGSLQAGLNGDNTMLYTKASLDFISSIIFASTLGVGVMLSAAFVFVFQGAIVLLAQFVAPVLTDPIISNMTCVGSLLIIAIGLNMLKLPKEDIKVMDMVPAIFIPIVFILF